MNDGDTEKLKEFGILHDNSDRRTNLRPGQIEMPPFLSKRYEKSSKFTSLARNAAIVVAGLGIVGLETKTLDDAAEFAKDTTNTILHATEQIGQGIKVPVDAAIDFTGALIPDDEPDKARIPNKILLGKVEITTSKELSLKRSPDITTDFKPLNSIPWDDARLANKEVKEGRFVFTPIELATGGTLIVTNPEIVVTKNKQYIQLYRDDGSTAFVEFQESEFEKEIKDDPTEPSKFITAETMQDAGGIRVVIYSSQLPETTSNISLSR